MSRRNKFWAVISLAVLVVILIPLTLRWRAQWQLGAYRKKLIASGEKLTVAELAPKRNAEATNSGRFLRLASTVHTFGNYSPSTMLSIKPGADRVAWRQSRCLEEGMDTGKPDADVWPVLTDAVKTNEQSLRELKVLIDQGGIEFFQDYSQANLNMSTHLPWSKGLVSGLSARAMLALHEGQAQEAFEDIRAAGIVSQLTLKDPMIIDQLVAYACMDIVAGDCWEALQMGGWTDEQLGQWQHQWDQPAILEAVLSALAMERVRGLMMFQGGRASRQAFGVKNNAEILSDSFLSIRTGVNELLTAYPRYWGWRWIWSYRDEQRYLEVTQSMIDVSRDAQKGRAILSSLKDQATSTDEAAAQTTPFDVVTAAIANYKFFVGRTLRAQAVANMVAGAIALERYRLAHHAYPDSLLKLVPDFLKTVPVDCMDGHDLRYRPNPDGTYLLYSVGADGVDNGGDPTPVQGKILGFRNGKDWVWPRPATAEEMQVYEAEQSKPGKRK